MKRLGSVGWAELRSILGEKGAVLQDGDWRRRCRLHHGIGRKLKTPILSNTRVDEVRDPLRFTLSWNSDKRRLCLQSSSSA